MARVILYIAQSIDGKIAKPNGDIDWLEAIPAPEGEDYGYAEFYKSIDTVVMGNNTFRQIINMGINYPYKDKVNYVITKNTLFRETAEAKFISSSIPEFIRKLKSTPDRNIWLIGGSQINTLFLENKLIDEIMLFTMPIVIGEGIPLFAGCCIDQQIQLIENRSYANGTILTRYKITE